MDSPIRFALAGYGYIGHRHTGIISGHPDCRMVAIADIRESLREEAETVQGIPFFSSVESMLHDGPEADVLCICTPNGLHTQHALAALKRGYHVVIEKPMGLRRLDCEAVLSASLQAGRQVFCVMQNRYTPTAVWLRELMEKEVLGRIFHVQVNCFWNRDARYYKPGNWHGSRKLDGGVLFTQFSHFVDMIFWLFGDISDLLGRFWNHTHQTLTELPDDSGIVQFQFLKGGSCSLQYSTAVYDRNFESSITIIGEKGTVKVGGQYMERVEYCHVQDYEMPELPPANPPNDYGAYKGTAANHHFVFDNVVETLHGKSKIATNAYEGMKVVEIIERIYALRT
jgi:predicted dehydrogenase